LEIGEGFELGLGSCEVLARIERKDDVRSGNENAIEARENSYPIDFTFVSIHDMYSRAEHGCLLRRECKSGFREKRGTLL
jgi:hypothetical protein